MNGQEKDFDIHAGATTAEFWEYDARIGRRWNVDPVVVYRESSYLAFGNCPIYYKDIKGNYKSKFFAKVANFFHGGNGVGQNRDKNSEYYGEYFYSTKEESDNVDNSEATIVEELHYGKEKYRNKAVSGGLSEGPLSSENMMDETFYQFEKVVTPIYEKVKEDVKEGWNSKIARSFIDDYYQISIGGSTGSFVNGSTEINFVLVTRGTKPGLYYNTEVGGGVSNGLGTGLEVMWGVGNYIGETKNTDLAGALGGLEVSTALDIKIYGVPVEFEAEVGLDDNMKPNSYMIKRGISAKPWYFKGADFQISGAKATDAKPILTINGFFK